MSEPHGGDLVADVLCRNNVRFLFALCGGHISPILTGAHARGIRVIDVRHEANAVFAADAVARLTGTVGVAAVTAGPGVTNAVTAMKNAQMAETPLVLLGGATATLLKGRGSLQDIDQHAVMKPLTKWSTTVTSVPALAPTLERAFAIAKEGVPGPVFVEIPVDLLYSEALVRSWYEKEAGMGKGKGLTGRAVDLYLRGHLYKQFHAPALPQLPRPGLPRVALGNRQADINDAARALAEAKRPVIVVGSQTLAGVKDPARLAKALDKLGAPVYLAGAARGLLGRQHELQFRHARGAALKAADVAVVLGFPFDFRLGYGRGFASDGMLIAANLSAAQLRKNRKPDIAVEMHGGDFLCELAARTSGVDSVESRTPWFEAMREREARRDGEIVAKASAKGERVNPLHFFMRLEEQLADDAVLVVDGGDFVATASYILRPRAPLSWLDPGVFGTLGVGGGFSLGATLCRPGAEVWLIWGDGSSAYSLAEFDTYVRHGVAPIAVIGNDASWSQIAREQVEVLGTPLGTELRHTDYHKVAEGYGGVGLEIREASEIDRVLAEAKTIARSGKPVCINVQLQATDFRKGSLSM